jgi:hypothetical protein
MDETKGLFPSSPPDDLLKDLHRIQSHSNYDGDLFHQHIQAIDAWILDQIRWIVPSAPLTMPTSISFLPFPKLDGRVDRDRVLTGSDMLITIAELRPSEVDTHHARTQLFFHWNMSGSPAFDLLLREFMAEPTRCNERYRLDGEKCARLARNLWISVLPWYVIPI